jgi:plasmid stability protein
VRTTLTLDEDVRAKLEVEMRKTGRSFKETVNEVLRIGLTAPRPVKPAKPFEIYARDLGARPGYNFDNIEELLDQIEGPLRR